MIPSSNPTFQKALTATVAATLTLTLLAALYLSRWIILATLIGIGIGVLVAPFLETMKRKLRIPQGLSAVAFILLLVLTIASVSTLIFNLISSQLIPLAGQLPQFLMDAREQIIQLLGSHAWLKTYLESVNIGPAVTGALETLIQGLQFGTIAIAGLFFALFVALYFASAPDYYLQGVLSLFPAYLRPNARKLLRLSGNTLRKWFFAQLVAMLVVGVLTGVGLWIIGVPYAAGFGLLAALLDIVPYIGPMVAFLTIGMVTLASDPGNLIWVGVIFVLVQNFESDVVIPLVMRAGVKLPPIQLMVIVIIMAQWFGLLGVLVGPPLLAIARAIYLETYVKRMDTLVSAFSIRQSRAQSHKEKRKAG